MPNHRIDWHRRKACARAARERAEAHEVDKPRAGPSPEQRAVIAGLERVRRENVLNTSDRRFIDSLIFYGRRQRMSDAQIMAGRKKIGQFPPCGQSRNG